MPTSTSLVHLFNVELADFVRLLPSGEYEAVEWPKDATHELVPTVWNVKKNLPNQKGKWAAPAGFALSVCAVPLHRKFRMRGAFIKALHPLPKGFSVYVADGDVAGKRIVIKQMIESMQAEVKQDVDAATSEQCDLIYRNLMVAHFGLVRR